MFLWHRMVIRGLLQVHDSVRGYPLRAFFICLFAYSTAQMDLALFGYAIPSIRAEFNLSLTEVMKIVSIAFLIGGCLLVFISVFIDTWGRLPLFQFSLFGSSLLVAMTGLASSVAALTVLRGTSIAIGGLSYPVTGAIITEEFPARVRGIFMGLLQIGYPLGWAMASLWSMWILTEFGWRYLFLVGFVSLPMVFVVRHFLREPPRSAASQRNASIFNIFKLFGSSIRYRAAVLFSAQFLFVWAYAASIFGEYKLTRRNTVVIWTLLGAGFFQLLVWRAETFGQIFFMYSVMSMFFYGSAAVKFAYLAEVFPTPVRATAMAVCGSFAVTLGSAAGPYYVSLAVEAWGWNLGYAMLTGIPLMLAGLLYLALDSLPSGLEIEEIETIYSQR